MALGGSFAVTGAPDRGDALVRLIRRVSALDGVFSAYETVVSAATDRLDKAHFSATDLVEGWHVSFGRVGCAGGVIRARRLNERRGPEDVLVLSGVSLTVAAFACAAALPIAGLCAVRILDGMRIEVGMALVVSRGNISKTAPPACGDRGVSLFQVTIAIGVAAEIGFALRLQDAPVAMVRAETGGLEPLWLVRQMWRGVFVPQAVPAGLLLLISGLPVEGPAGMWWICNGVVPASVSEKSMERAQRWGGQRRVPGVHVGSQLRAALARPLDAGRSGPGRRPAGAVDYEDNHATFSAIPTTYCLEESIGVLNGTPLSAVLPTVSGSSRLLVSRVQLRKACGTLMSLRGTPQEAETGLRKSQRSVEVEATPGPTGRRAPGQEGRHKSRVTGSQSRCRSPLSSLSGGWKRTPSHARQLARPSRCVMTSTVPPYGVPCLPCAPRAADCCGPPQDSWVALAAGTYLPISLIDRRQRRTLPRTVVAGECADLPRARRRTDVVTRQLFPVVRSDCGVRPYGGVWGTGIHRDGARVAGGNGKHAQTGVLALGTCAGGRRSCI